MLNANLAIPVPSIFKNRNIQLLAISSIVLIAGMFVLSEVQNRGDVVALLRACGVYNPPTWLVWVLVGTAGTGAVVSVAAAFFGFVPGPALAKSLACAASFGA